MARRRGAQDDPWAQLVAGCEAFPAASADPEVQRIMLIDAPAVLGGNEWRAMDEAASGRLLVSALTGLVETGTIPPQPIEPVARLLSGAMNEAALWLAQLAGPAGPAGPVGPAGPTDLAATTAALRRLRESLRLSN